MLGYSSSDASILAKKYMALRGVLNYEEKPNERWHRLMSEIIANDFRVSVMDTEVEFWPHEVSKLAPSDPAVLWWLAGTRAEMEKVVAPLGNERHK
jgi:hypothetical protein